jgi:hypothetical protein
MYMCSCSGIGGIRKEYIVLKSSCTISINIFIVIVSVSLFVGIRLNHLDWVPVYTIKLFIKPKHI